MTCVVLFPKLPLVWMFTRAAVCRLIRFCLACGDECVQLEDILAFPPEERQNPGCEQRVVYGRAPLFLSLFLFLFFFFFLPSRFFRVRIPETFPWFSSLNISPPQIRSNTRLFHCPRDTFCRECLK